VSSAVCWKCVEDKYLSERVKSEGKRRKCSVCGKTWKGVSVEKLAEILNPVLHEHIRHGRQVPTIGEGDDDTVYYEQQGDDLSYWVQVILDQYFDFNEEIVEAVVDSEYVDVADGEEAFFDTSVSYESTPVSLHEYYAEWDSVLQELKHSRRFFSSSAQSLFGRLFKGVETMKSFGENNQEEPVVWTMHQDTRLYRARTCSSFSQFKEFVAQPMKNAGPPPTSNARPGRMNVEGVVVFYGAIDSETCLAEMRPALGGDTALIELRTTKPLRVLDFTRLEESHGKGLSYFQPDFSAEVERRAFLRRLHTLISQPVVPEREADYLITQTMAEYLAHVHEEPFDGIMFKSVQREGGTNVVLFGAKSSFPLEYVDKSLKLFATKEIQYTHRERRYYVLDGGKVSLAWDEDEEDGLFEE
jgi:hypothetical protein